MKKTIAGLVVVLFAISGAAASAATHSSKAGQTIHFVSKAPTAAYADGDYKPIAKASSGLTVRFSIDAHSTKGVCREYSQSLVLLSGSGKCIIDANQAGNAKYAAAPQVTLSFTVRALTGGLG